MVWSAAINPGWMNLSFGGQRKSELLREASKLPLAQRRYDRRAPEASRLGRRYAAEISGLAISSDLIAGREDLFDSEHGRASSHHSSMIAAKSGFLTNDISDR